MVNHAVFRHVQSKQVVIKSHKHFVEYADSVRRNICVIFVDDDDLQLNFHEECRKKTVYIWHITSDMKC